ncbi:ATP-binding protein [Nostoc sp. LPT]|uniref:ATP-binding protein n=1 Tax=Nostoc sp. LPT TaxID=2815387 RepID=UPI001DEC4535|nr:ATP-binding protein [Nostoc sp. LPT]MBN4003342.1 ATP-binding protein [Nostoc sp. LPT]
MIFYRNADWRRENQRYLMQELARVRQALMQAEEAGENTTSPPLPLFASSPPSALEQLCQTFKLSAFERDVLLLCAGVELDASFAPLCAASLGDAQKNYPTFSLALAVLEDAYWEALAPTASLRRSRLIEIGAGNTLTTSPLRIDEQILHYLTGTYHLNERLVAMGAAVAKSEELVPSHWQLVEKMVSIWYLTPSEPLLPLLQLCGNDAASLLAIASTACDKLNFIPYTLPVELLPTDIGILNLVKCLWEREFSLNNLALLLECDRLEMLDGKEEKAISQFLESIQAPVILLSSDRRRQKHRPLITFDVTSPTSEEQRLLWQKALSDFAPNLNGHVDTLVSHFNLSDRGIRAACLKARSQESGDVNSPPLLLWDICRIQARPRLDELAQRMETSAGWDDLVLPEREKQVLRDAAKHIHQRTKVYEHWGFGGKSKRGLGISALFAGASGTGKTMAAEVLAQELRLDLYRIDLSAVVSKYIGETEKNLGRVFDAAEMGGVILLFDEADALFGKRSEVKDSHDRHANMEVAYLLQRMEAYPGLSILTTNLKNSIDQAFLRRIRFIVQFLFPDINQRAEIWLKAFPSQTPIEELDEWKLANLQVAGGNIRNIALNAAFIAAEADQPVRMEHILQAAKNEYMKMERQLTDVEVKGWVKTANG